LEDQSAIPAPATAPPSLRRFFTFGVLAELSFTGGIWILYLQHRGFSLAEIGLAESVFHLAPVTLELPSGSLADMVGRKWSLALGPVLAAISALLMLQADSLWVLLPAMYLSGASYAFRSGATQAFLYDSLAEGEQSGRFAGLLGKLMSASYIVIAVTMWIGGVLADRDFRWPFLLAALAALAAAAIAVTLREPERESTLRLGLTGTVREALRIVRTQPGLAWLLGFGAGLFTLLTLVGLYAQAVLSERGLPPSRVTLVIGSALIFTAIGSWFSGRIGARTGFARLAIATTLAAVATALGLGGAGVAIAVGLFFLGEFITGVFEPMLAARVNEGLPPGQRATILSVEGFLFSITMIWAFPLFGAAAERYGWLAAYAGASVAVVVLLVAWLASERRIGHG
jgi:MFS family permease